MIQIDRILKILITQYTVRIHKKLCRTQVYIRLTSVRILNLLSGRRKIQQMRKNNSFQHTIGHQHNCCHSLRKASKFPRLLTRPQRHDRHTVRALLWKRDYLCLSGHCPNQNSSISGMTIDHRSAIVEYHMKSGIIFIQHIITVFDILLDRLLRIAVSRLETCHLLFHRIITLNMILQIFYQLFRCQPGSNI